MAADPLVDEVRQARHKISEECGHDIWKLFERYKAMQEKMKAEGKARFVSSPPVPSGTDKPSKLSG